MNVIPIMKENDFCACNIDVQSIQPCKKRTIQEEMEKSTLDDAETAKDLNEQICEVFVHQPLLVDAVKASLDDWLYDDNFEKNWQMNVSFYENVTKLFTAFLKTCSEAMEVWKKDGDNVKSVSNSVLNAFHIVCYLSLDAVKELTNKCPVFFGHSLIKNGDVMKFICLLLNPDYVGFLKWSKRKVCTNCLDVKRKIIKDFLEKARHENLQDVEKLHFFQSCLEILGIPMGKEKGVACEEDALDVNSERVFSLPQNIEDLIEYDGSIYDKARDPPGQRSVYIPPGDETKETYRLSTFMRFPPAVPVHPNRLASAGFFYTGYKDRVKCFSCGLCIENWVVGDDVSLPRWHRSDCKMMLQQECGNIPLGGDLFPKYKRPNQASRQPPATDTAGSSTLPMKLATMNVSGTPAGQLLSPNSESALGPFNGWNQTAKPVATTSSNNRTYARSGFAKIPFARHERLLKSLELNKEAHRLKSFETWPVETRTVQPSDLARSGFFYLGNLDRVQCFSCRLVLRNWQHDDVADEEHKKQFPGCRMMNGTEEHNVPLLVMGGAAFSQPTAVQSPPEPSESEQRNLQDMFPCRCPVNPHMANEETRFETFDRRWPQNRVNATPRQIAKAGFFFLGERDRVKCWYCNGGLQNWDPNDEPWSEHAKWFPACEFLLRRMGPDFVHRMVARYPTLRRPILRGGRDIGPHHAQDQVLRTNHRPPSPPPPMIDPRIELQRKKEELSKTMENPIIASALDMGFSRKLVKKTVEMKLEGNEMYNNLSDLVDDLTAHELSYVSDEETESAFNGQTSAKATSQIPGTSSGGTTFQLPAGETGGSSSSPTPMDTSPEDMPPSMATKIQELQDERKCKICLGKTAEVVFIPCGHLCSCTTCAISLKKCPICREKISKTMRTYMS